MRITATLSLHSDPDPIPTPKVYLRDGHGGTRVHLVLRTPRGEALDWYGEDASHVAADLAAGLGALAGSAASDRDAVREVVRRLARDVLGQGDPEQIGDAILSDPLVGDAMRQAVNQ